MTRITFYHKNRDWCCLRRPFRDSITVYIFLIQFWGYKMPTYRSEDVRNIALVGHSGVGKTMLLEALLHKAGAIQEKGSIERGTTVTDYDELEKERHHSLDTALASADYKGAHINFVDTPGYPDFRGPTLAAAGAVETAFIVINAQAGIEFNTHRMMERAHEGNLCRMIVINHIDGEQVDLEKLVREIRETFGNICLPINLPANDGKEVVDCFFNLDGDADIFSVEAAHTEITDQIVEMDEELMEEYLEEGSVEPERLHDAFEQALRDGHLVPICFTSAQTETGVGKLLDMCVKLMPSPAEGNPPTFFKGEDEDAEQVTPEPDPDAHVLAHAFKITNDPYVGKLSVFRIYQGTITKETQLYVGDARKPFRVGHLFKLQGNKHVEIERGIPGDICAVAKVEEIEYDSVLHDSHDEDSYHLKPRNFPNPMYSLAIEPEARGDEAKLSTALHKLTEEDPCFKFEHSMELNEMIVSGLGAMHLQVMLERMDRRHNAKVVTHPPRIAYRETISGAAEGHCRHKKQTGGAGQFGEVYLRVRPLPRGEGFSFVNRVVGGVIPTNLIPAVEKGIRQILEEGAVAGYTLQDLEVEVYDGKHHAVDSKEIAFVTAARKALLDAVEQARPVILEPIVNIHVTVPDLHMGDVTGGLASKRARINGSNTAGSGLITIEAQIPLSELTDYHTELNAITAGQGRYLMDLSHYDPVPGSVQKQLVKDFNRKEEE